jgi:hypothetical protein
LMLLHFVELTLIHLVCLYVASYSDMGSITSIGLY